MSKGLYYSMPDRMNCHFTRSSRNLRRIEYSNASYMPIKNEVKAWQKIIPHAVDYQYYSAAQIMKFDDNELQKYFSELAESETSIFGE